MAIPVRLESKSAFRIKLSNIKLLKVSEAGKALGVGSADDENLPAFTVTLLAVAPLMYWFCKRHIKLVCDSGCPMVLFRLLPGKSFPLRRNTRSLACQ